MSSKKRNDEESEYEDENIYDFKAHLEKSQESNKRKTSVNLKHNLVLTRKGRNKDHPIFNFDLKY